MSSSQDQADDIGGISRGFKLVPKIFFSSLTFNFFVSDG